MLLGLNALKSANRQPAATLDAWFESEEKAPAQNAISAAKAMFSQVSIGSSIKSIQRQAAAQVAPPAPKAEPAEVTSPYQALSYILEPNSRSSRWLAQYGLLTQFSGNDCFVDMSMTPDGGMSAVLRSPQGFRRTVVCRPDGTSAQRVTGPQGEEIVRFNNEGDAIYAVNKRESELAIA